ncbi:transposable element Tc1 transposase [Trichonephila clavipes]|nr:transposable element Tc1 transposase [Trichonephila clavipes]
MVVNDRTDSSRQLAARLSTATGVLMSVSSMRRHLLHRGLRARVPLYRIPLKANHRRLQESRVNLWDHDGCIRVRRYAAERCLPGCIIERHSGLKPSNMLEFVPFLQGIPGAAFQQNNALPHVAMIVLDFSSDQHMQLLPWPEFSPDLSPIEHVCDLVCLRLARDPLPAASKD